MRHRIIPASRMRRLNGFSAISTRESSRAVSDFEASFFKYDITIWEKSLRQTRVIRMINITVVKVLPGMPNKILSLSLYKLIRIKETAWSSARVSDYWSWVKISVAPRLALITIMIHIRGTSTSYTKKATTESEM